MSPKEISAAFQSEIDTSDTVDQLALKLSAARQAQHDAQARSQSITAAIKALVISQYGDASPVLAEFGFSPRKVATKTVAEKMLVVEKSLATRAARHTMGSKQKASIHGDVNAPAATPPTAPAIVATPAPAPASAPALNGASNGVTNGASNGASNGVTSGLMFAKSG
ncbi:MAG: hypothetical protein ACRELY_19165 [Polyangiaceae bacterium]